MAPGARRRKVVTATPENSETPLASVRSWVTPTPWFFVRNHFTPPQLDAKSWRLRVEGCVQRKIEWTLDDLLALPECTVFATVECAGNGRSFLGPRVPGVPTLKEEGHADFAAVTWYSLSGPAGLPADIVASINHEVVKAMDRPQVKRQIAQDAIESKAMSPAEVTRFMQSEIDRWTPMITRLVGPK